MIAHGLALMLLTLGAAPPSGENPQLRRLGAVDQKRVEELNQRMGALEDADQYPEAVAVADEVAALYTDRLGASHWLTRTMQSSARVLRKVAQLTPAERRAWQETFKQDNAANQLRLAGKLAEAEAMYRRAWATQRRLVGEEYSCISTLVNNLAGVIAQQMRSAEAERLFRYVVRMRTEVLGREHPDTAGACINLGGVLLDQERYAEAERLFRSALDRLRTTVGEIHTATANAYRQVGTVLEEQHRLAEAFPFYDRERSILWQGYGRLHPEVARCCSVCGENLHRQGKQAAALPYYEEAVRIYLATLGPRARATAVAYHKLGTNLKDQGKLAESLRVQGYVVELAPEVFGEKDLTTAIVCVNLAALHRDLRQYDKALTLHRRALAIRRERLGEQHVSTAESYNYVGVVLIDLERPREAEQSYEQALEIVRGLPKRDNELTLMVMNNLIAVRIRLGRYRQLERLYEEYLAGKHRLVGEEHPEIAFTYHNFGFALRELGKYREAEEVLRKALQIRLKLLGEDHAVTANTYNALGVQVGEMGRYAEGEALVRRGLAIRRKLQGEASPDLANSHNSLGHLLHLQGKYAEAQAEQETALQMRLKLLGPAHPDTATAYNNLASNYASQGKWAEALQLAEEALQHRLRVLDARSIATAHSYNNLGTYLVTLRQTARARECYQKALEIATGELGEEHYFTVKVRSNLALEMKRQNEQAKALAILEQVAASFRKLQGPQHPDTALALNNLATALNTLGRTSEAIKMHREALAIRQRGQGDSHPDTLVSFANLGRALLDSGKGDEAITLLEAATRGYEMSRLRVQREASERGLFALDRSPYPLFTCVLAQQGRSQEAWQALEADLARGLLDESAARRGRQLSPAQMEQRNRLEGKLAELATRSQRYLREMQSDPTARKEFEQCQVERAAAEKELGTLAAVVSQGELATLAEVQAALRDDAALLVWTGIRDAPEAKPQQWGCVVRRSGPPRWERLRGSGPGGTWKAEDRDLYGRVYRSIITGGPARQVEEGLRQLARQRLEPLEKHLAGVRHLHVVNTDIAGFPVELLSERYTISYAPSGTWLARHEKRASGSGLVAVGDPEFADPTKRDSAKELPPGGWLLTQVVPGGAGAAAGLKSGDVLLRYDGHEPANVAELERQQRQAVGRQVKVEVWREGETRTAVRQVAGGALGVVVDPEPAPRAVAVRRQSSRLVAAVRGGTWAELPGTRVELASLERLFGERITLLSGTEATAASLERLRASGKLGAARYLHFATHGETNHERAYYSALILARGEKVTAEQVLNRWKLQADLVTLSACESGLGKSAGGDGLLGFAQAFLLAGARTVCLSLWKVDDAATALLMDRFYANLLGRRAGLTKPMGKAAALAEAKEWLRTLPLEEAVQRSATLHAGVARGKGKAGTARLVVPREVSGAGVRPFAHPKYWAAFVLMGDPQ